MQCPVSHSGEFVISVRTVVRGAGTLLLNVIPFGLQAVRAGTGDRIVQFEKIHVWFVNRNSQPHYGE